MGYNDYIKQLEKRRHKKAAISDEIVAWRQHWLEVGPIKFAEEVLACPRDVPEHPILKKVPDFVILTDDQREFLDNLWKRAIDQGILAAGRGAGKTFCIAIYVTWRMCCFDFFTITVMGGCYDPETEVLTKDGWKYFKDIIYSDDIVTLNPDTYNIEYQKPSNIISYKYTGKMFHQSSEQIDLLVTPEHDMFVSHPKKRTFGLSSAESIYGKERIYKKNGIWMGERKDYFILPESIRYRGKQKEILNPKYIPMDDWLKFFGLWLAEGWTYYQTVEGGHRYRVSLRNNDTELILELKSIMESNGFTVNLTNDGTVLVIDNKQLFDYLRSLGKAEDKYIPREFMSLTSEQLKILLTYYAKGDGHLESGSDRTIPRLRTWTVSKRLRNDFQELALKIGISANCYNLGKKKSVLRDGRVINGQHDCYYISYIEKSNEPTVNPYKTTRSNIFQRWEDYNDMVYCVTVPNHIIYVRRNGKPVWCGNSAEQSGKIKEYVDFWRLTNDEVNYCIYRSITGGNRPAQIHNRWGSYARFPACSETAARGPHVTQVIVDETCQGEAKSTGGALAIRAARGQMMSSAQSLLLYTSTAQYIFGTFFSTWRRADKLGFKKYRWSVAKYYDDSQWFIPGTKSPNWDLIDAVLYKDRDKTHWIPNVWWITDWDIKNYRMNSTDDEFLVEVLGGISRGSGLVFSREDLRACICTGEVFTEDSSECIECEPYTDKCPMMKKLGLTLEMISNRKMGVDLGDISPNAVTVVGQRQPYLFALFSDERTGLRTEEMLKWLEDLAKEWKIFEIFMDPEERNMRDTMMDRGYSTPHLWAGGGGQKKNYYVASFKRFIESHHYIIPKKFQFLITSLIELAYDEKGDIRKHNDHSFDSIIYGSSDFSPDWDEGSLWKIKNRGIDLWG